MIVKWYKRNGTGFYGQDVGSWSASWARAQDLEKSFAHADRDYLAPFFRKYFPRPPKVILEGGCGIARYVVAYRRLGYDIRGVDFSRETILRLKDMDHTLPVEEADITALPYPASSFDCYYSGGVVEHFEEGPARALNEARRVLKPGGLLLATVPYINLLRRLHFCLLPAKEGHQFFQLRRQSCGSEPPPEGFAFSEYLFDVCSIKPYFEASGFVLEEAIPTDFLWGEIGVCLQKIRRGGSDPSRSTYDQSWMPSPACGQPQEVSGFKSFLYEFLVTENRDRLLFRFPLTALNYLSGHMIMFVARAV